MKNQGSVCSEGMKQKNPDFCATSHKEVAQFYSPAFAVQMYASDIASSDIRLTTSGIRALTM